MESLPIPRGLSTRRCLRRMTALAVAVATCLSPPSEAFQHTMNRPRATTSSPQSLTILGQQRSLPPHRIRDFQTAEAKISSKLSILQQNLPPFQDSIRKNGRIFGMAMISLILATLLLFPKAAMASSVALEGMEATASSLAAVAIAPLPPTPVAAASVCAPISAAMELQLSLRILYAAVMGAALGKERSFAKHSAGVRTMSLVSMGAAAFTVCSQFGFAGRFDPARVAANVVSGVGFVGAGVITTSSRNQQNVVHGLTTAATIWLSAAVGMACGMGLFQIGTTAAMATLFILRMGRKKPKHRLSKQHEQSSSPLEATPTRILEELEDQEAEIHITSVWDEDINGDNEEEKVKDQVTAEGKAILFKEDNSDPSNLMESVVRSAWQNSTNDYDHLFPIERSERQRSSSSEHRP